VCGASCRSAACSSCTQGSGTGEKRWNDWPAASHAFVQLDATVRRPR
jgi:hypothetical protein